MWAVVVIAASYDVIVTFAAGAVMLTVTSGTVSVPGVAFGMSVFTVASELTVPEVGPAPGLARVSTWPFTVIGPGSLAGPGTTNDVDDGTAVIVLAVPAKLYPPGVLLAALTLSPTFSPCGSASV